MVNPFVHPEFFVINKAGRIQGNVIVDVILVNVCGDDVLVFAFQELFRKLDSDFVRLLRRHFSRLERLNQMPGMFPFVSLVLPMPCCLVISNVAAAVSGEHPNEETSVCSSVLSESVTYFTSFSTEARIGKTLIYAISLLPFLSGFPVLYD